MDVYDHPNGKADVKETLRKAYFTSAPDVKGDHARKAKKEPETASPAQPVEKPLNRLLFSLISLTNHRVNMV